MLSLLRALPLLWQLGIGVGILAGLGGGYAYWHHKVYTQGYDAAIADVAAVNKEAVDAALQARKKADDCADRGFDWDVTRGVCAEH